MKKILFLIIVSLAVWPKPLAFAAEPSKWKEDKQEHFIIYYKNAPEDFIREVEKASEEYYQEICENLGFHRYKGWTWDERAKIYIYDDDEDYKKESSNIPWAHGVAFAEQKIIRTFPSASGFFDSVLPHEMGHIILREFIGHEAKVPLWFEEGVAMYQEKAKRWGAHKIVQKAIADKSFVPLKDLTSFALNHNASNEAFINLFYAEAASVVNYLINELGYQRFVRFCRELKEGQPFDWALKSVYLRFDDINGLNKAWMSYLETQ
ncbi:MAG: hypothetical protein HQL24_01265 [Candidatus Omnitrophica bacterium]|nr:hypothetical protein [Candidatus Omnitrophota bacterium]